MHSSCGIDVLVAVETEGFKCIKIENMPSFEFSGYKLYDSRQSSLLFE